MNSYVPFNTQLYEIIPGFIVGLLTMVVVSYLSEKPSKEVLDLFDTVKNAKGVEVGEDGVPYLVGEETKEETAE